MTELLLREQTLLAPSQGEFAPHGESNLIDELQQPRIALFWGAQAPTRTLLTVLTGLAAGGRSARVFDGGNSFDGYFVARLARRLSPQPYAVLNRIRLSRAFTCFQLAELIENAGESTDPLFVLDLLATFYDESVPLRDSDRLLAGTLSHLKRLAAVGPVVVGACEPKALVKERWALLERVQAAADASWMLRAPLPPADLQPRLFS